MQRITAAISLILCLVAATAHAGRVVMFFTDSRGCTGSTTNFPTLVDAARTDFTVCNKCKNGRKAWTGVTEFAQAFSECQATGEVSDVVILLGVSDILDGRSNADVVTDLHWLADEAEIGGARGWIIEETPGPRAWGGILPADDYARANVTTLHEQNGASDACGGSIYRLIPNALGSTFHWVRNATTDPYYCSNDELHPTQQACRQSVLADPVIAALP